MIDNFLKQKFFNNTVSDYLMAIGVFVAGLMIVWALKRLCLNYLKKWSERTPTKFDDFMVKVIEKWLLPVIYFGLFYICIHFLKLKPILMKSVDLIGLLLLVYIGIRLLLSIFDYSIDNYLIAKKKIDLSKQQAIKVVLTAMKIFIWSLAAVVIMDNLGIKISPLMTGLGIGGVAVALASQAVLGDMFNYFTIFFDRPFELGDFIIIGDYMGTVEHIGIKTTRIRSLGGEQLVFSNTDLTNSRVRNYKRMEQRRVVFRFGVTYDTSVERLREIPEVVRRIIENSKDTRFDRAHFASYGDFSLVFEVVYHVLNSDYNQYMDIQQEINLNLKQELTARNISFALPTQTLFIAGQQPTQ